MHSMPSRSWALALFACAAPLLAGSARLVLANQTGVPWRVWGSAQVRLELDEPAPAQAWEEKEGLHLPARSFWNVRVHWAEGAHAPGRARVHAEPLEGGSPVLWSLNVDQLPDSPALSTILLTPGGVETHLAQAKPTVHPALPPAAHSSSAAARPAARRPDRADAPASSSARETKEVPAPVAAPVRSKRSTYTVFATLELEAVLNARWITFDSLKRLPVIWCRKRLADGSLSAETQAMASPEPMPGCPIQSRTLVLEPGKLYYLKIDTNSRFATDPRKAYSRVLTLSGPGGEPWNAASLVGARDPRAREGDDPWQFALLEGDALAGFRRAGRNRFAFDPVDPGAPQGRTRLPSLLHPDVAQPRGSATKRARPGDLASPPTQRSKKASEVYATLTIVNRGGQDAFLRARGIKQGIPPAMILGEDGGTAPGWGTWDACAREAGTRVLTLPAGKTVRFELGRGTRFGDSKRSRLYEIDTQGGVAGATLLVTQTPSGALDKRRPWIAFLQDAAGAAVEALPGLALAGGDTLVLTAPEPEAALEEIVEAFGQVPAPAAP